MNITLPMPTSWNRLYRITCRGGYARMYKSKEYNDWVELAGWKLKSQWRKRKPIESDITLYIKVYYCRRKDLDNIVKAVGDLLQDLRVIKNDKQIDFLQVWRAEKVKSKDERIELEVEEIE